MQLRVKWSRVVEEFFRVYNEMFLSSNINSSVNLDLSGMLIEKPGTVWSHLVLLDTLLSMLSVEQINSTSAMRRKFDQYDVLKQSVVNAIAESFVDYQLTSNKPYEQYQLSRIITMIDFPDEWSDNHSLYNYVSFEILMKKWKRYSNEIEICFNNYYMKAYGINAIIIKICNVIYVEVQFLFISIIHSFIHSLVYLNFIII